MAAQFDPGDIGNDQTICYGYAPSPLSFTSQPSGGTTPYFYRWQRSNDNGASWNDISGTSASLMSYSPPVLGRTAWFRCKVTDYNNTLIGYTEPVNITVRTALQAGLVGDAQTIYYGNQPDQLGELEPASGGSGFYTYKWQSSPDGFSWSDILYANSNTFTPPKLGRNTWYRRYVNDESCGSKASNSIAITMKPITIFTTETPLNINNEALYNLGTEFKVLEDGLITKARIYTSAQESGEHIINLYMKTESGFLLINGPFSWFIESGIEGWREFDLPSPIVVQKNTIYMISITNSPGNNYYAQSEEDFSPIMTNSYIEYIRGRYTMTPSGVPTEYYYGACYFRDITYIPTFSPGGVGPSQSICYNTFPQPITEIASPFGGDGEYSYQWQSSNDNLSWTDIDGATSVTYAPPAMTVTTFYRRVVSSENLTGITPSVEIKVSPETVYSQLHDDLTIYENTSTSINISIEGGVSPYNIIYELNGVQFSLDNYVSENDISTGALATGNYEYTLISVSDAFGCPFQSLGSSITISAAGQYVPPASTNKCLIIVNEESDYYSDYFTYIKPYLSHFGIPFDIYNHPDPDQLPLLSNYALIILGHQYIYNGETIQYPVNAIETAVAGGVGLLSFDSHFFDFQSGFAESLESAQENSGDLIQIHTNPPHYITHEHLIDESYHPTNDQITLVNWDMSTKLSDYGLDNALTLASINDSPLLQVATHENGRIVKWNGYDWVYENVLGPVRGMDDLLWRGIVWAARKPFVMMGLPPMITMRVDDCHGATENTIIEDFEWVRIGNHYGLIPWLGTFNNYLTANSKESLRTLLDNDLATASPHSFGSDEFIYFDHEGGGNDPTFDVAANTREAFNFYLENDLKISKYVVPHYYEISANAFPELRNVGVEFISTHMLPDNRYVNDVEWINNGPFRVNRYGLATEPKPVYYADNIFFNAGNDSLFNCVTEIRDDGGYEWYPSYDVFETTARGIRHLRRSINSMVLPTLFTHEYYLTDISDENWHDILGNITSEISVYNPEYVSMDYAIEYIRAKNNLTITNISDDLNLVYISCTGDNDLDTKCYLFNEFDGVISYRLILLPQIDTGTITVAVVK